MKTSGPLSILLRGAFCVTQAACPHLLRRSRRITRDSLAHLLPGRDRAPKLRVTAIPFLVGSIVPKEGRRSREVRKRFGHPTQASTQSASYMSP